MKKLINHNYITWIFIGLLIFSAPWVNAQEENKEKTEAPEKVVKLRYFNQDNSLQYLQAESQFKIGKKTEPRPNSKLKVYLDSAGTNNLLADLNTGPHGKARVSIPPSFKETWDANSKHTFIVVEEPSSKDEEEATYTLEIEKAKISIDTVNEEGVRSISVNVMKMDNGEWVPANEVEMRVGIERLGGILSGGTDDTYTTDSSGIVTVELNKLNLPGNDKGEIVLVARVDDNEYYGNLQVKQKVPWGVVAVTKSDFFTKRTLWATRDKAPYWLMFLSYSIIGGVWGTLIYLLFQLFRVRKIGRQSKSGAKGPSIVKKTAPIPVSEQK